MRPTVDATHPVAYECYGCGRREMDPTPRVCPVCGSAMRHTGRPRDR